MRKSIGIVVLVLVILLMGGIGMFFAFRELSSAIVDPIQAVNSDIHTQVAQVLHPTPTIMPDPVTIVNEVRMLARLETIQYTVEKVITAETGQEVLGVFSYRSFSTKADTGRGIGTYSMRLFGQRYLGGRVDFTSEEPEGTTFTVILPKVSARTLA